MYNLKKNHHPDYGLVIEITPESTGEYLSPLNVVQQALKEREDWQKQNSSKVRMLVDQQLLTPQKALIWSQKEYLKLPKCPICIQILNNDVYNHQLSDKLFCSIKCSDIDYNDQLEKMKDEEEIEFR